MVLHVSVTSAPRHARPDVRTGVPSAGPAVRRADLDGLRALAVLIVAVYHVWVHRVSGGVDVFLLLSGFFVGGALLRSFERGAPPDLRRYLPRLARRLLPTLLVVVAAVLVASALLLPRTRWDDVASESLASLAHLENWWLAGSGQAYGAADVTQSPLQHVWSLSVQGQLYVGVPLLLLAVWRLAGRAGAIDRSRVVLAVVVTAAVASFVYAAVSVAARPQTAYYDTAARAWEYLLGAVLAVALVRARTPRPRTGLVGWVGVTVVLLSGVIVDGGASFPGPAALVPLAGASLVMLAGAGTGASTGVTRLLAWGPLSRAGSYAYAFYLWHWPVLVMVVVLRDRPVGWLAGAGVLVLSALLAIGTKHLIEDPWRDAARVGHRRAVARPRRPLAAIAAVTVVVLPLAWLGYVASVRADVGEGGGDLRTHPGAMSVVEPFLYATDESVAPIPDVLAAGEDKVRAVFDGCGTPGGDASVTVCSYGDLDADRVIMVAGGSHAEQWIDAVAAVGEERGFRVDSMIRWGCSLFDGTDGMEIWVEADPTCGDWTQNALEELEERKPDVVLTTSTRPAGDGATTREIVPGAYVAAWERLNRAGITVVGLRDNPWLASSAVECLASASEITECAVERADVLDEVDPTSLVRLADAGADVRFLDLDDLLCPEETCPFVQGGRVVYRDDHHLTRTYTMSTVPVLDERLGPLLDWW